MTDRRVFSEIVERCGDCCKCVWGARRPTWVCVRYGHDIDDMGKISPKCKLPKEIMNACQ